jgi:hypothetical protein
VISRRAAATNARKFPCPYVLTNHFWRIPLMKEYAEYAGFEAYFNAIQNFFKWDEWYGFLLNFQTSFLRYCDALQEIPG